MAITEELITQAASDALGTTVVDDPRPGRSTSPSRGRGVRMVDLVVGARSASRCTRRMPIDDAARARRRHGVRVRAAWGTGQAHRGAVRGDGRARPRAPDVRHRPPGRDLAAGPRRPRRPVAHRALRAVRRLPRARQRLQRAQRPGRAAAALRGRAGGQGRRRRRARHASTRTTCGRSSTACRRPAGSASASTAS